MAYKKVSGTAAVLIAVVLVIVTSIWRYSSDPDSREAAQALAEPASLVQYSDSRLKTSVKDLNYGVDDVLRLRPVSYRFKNWPGYPRIGFIAQQIATVVPEIVSLDPEDPEVERERYYRVDYGQLVPVLVHSIQEQQATIESQQARIAVLEQEVADLMAIDGRVAPTRAGL